MIKLPFIVAAFSLLLAVPATAAAGGVRDGTLAVRYIHHFRRHVSPRDDFTGEPNLRVENALRWGYSQGYQHYPSGRGGLYGDGRYPGNVISNWNYPSYW